VPGDRLGAPGGRDAHRAVDARRRAHRIAAQAVGIAQAGLDVAAAYARQRYAFGAPIGRLRRDPAEAGRHADRDRGGAGAGVARGAAEAGGPPHTRRGRAGQAVRQRVRAARTGEAIQVLGGYGYTKEFPAERYYRDAKVTEIYEGTSEIQRLVIARALLGESARG
jgi:alkylation response protein AidB-like acyl-CoA dehydrogenase